jgi:hypothetical protein
MGFTTSINATIKPENFRKYPRLKRKQSIDCKWQLFDTRVTNATYFQLVGRLRFRRGSEFYLGPLWR